MLTLVQFTWVWNDLLFGMILVRSPEARSVQVALLGMQSLYGQADAPTIITATLIVSLPTLLLFLLLQKHFVRGLALGTTGLGLSSPSAAPAFYCRTEQVFR
jgi:multiple sugar transport system permease protein